MEGVQTESSGVGIGHTRLPSLPAVIPSTPAVLSVSWSALSLRHLSQVLLGSHTSSSHSGRFLCTPAVSKHSKPLFFCLRSFAEAFSACSVYSQGGWEGEPGTALRSRGQVRCPSLLSFRGTACTVPRMWLSPPLGPQWEPAQHVPFVVFSLSSLICLFPLLTAPTPLALRQLPK